MSDSKLPAPPTSNLEKWINVTYRGGVLLLVLLSGAYALSPVDAVPDVLLGPGQVDDIAVLLSGGGSVAFLTMLRKIMVIIANRPALRTGCLIVVVFIGGMMLVLSLLAFYGLYSLFSSL